MITIKNIQWAKIAMTGKINSFREKQIARKIEKQLLRLGLVCEIEVKK